MEERSPDELEKLFQSNLNDLEVSPSEKVWKDIEKRLDKKPRRRFFWIFFLLGILLVGGGSYGVYKSGFLKNDSGIIVENISNKDNHKNIKNAEVKNSPDLVLYNKPDKDKRNHQSNYDSNQNVHEPEKSSVARNTALNPGHGSGLSKSLSKNKNSEQTNNKKKVNPGSSTFNKNNVSVKENSSSLNESTGKISAVNNSDSNSKNRLISPSSESLSGKTNNSEIIITKDQNDEALKNNSTNTGKDIDRIENSKEDVLIKDQIISKVEPDVDSIRRNKISTNAQQDIIPAGNAVVLKDQSSATPVDTALSNPDSFISKNENPAVLKKDSTVENKKEKRVSKYSIAIFYSPDINKPFLSDRSIANPNDPYHFKNASHPQNTFSEGLTLGYDQTNRIRWQAGVSYTELTQSTDAGNFKFNWHDNLSFNFSNSFGSLQLNSTQFNKTDNSSGYPSDTIHIRYDTKENLAYIKLPVIFNYKVTTGRFSVYAIASITGIALVKNQMEFHVLNASSDKVISSGMSGIRKMNIGFMGGLGGQLNLFHGLYIFAEPNLKTSLLAINRHTSMKYIPFSLSISVGLGFHF